MKHQGVHHEKIKLEQAVFLVRPDPGSISRGTDPDPSSSSKTVRKTLNYNVFLSVLDIFMTFYF
jgi:hypothetical protein